MKKTLALTVAAALAVSATMLAAPQEAQAQIGITFGFGSGGGYGGSPYSGGYGGSPYYGGSGYRDRGSYAPIVTRRVVRSGPTYYVPRARTRYVTRSHRGGYGMSQRRVRYW